MEVIYLFGLSLLITCGILLILCLIIWGILKFFFPYLYFQLKHSLKN